MSDESHEGGGGGCAAGTFAPSRFLAVVVVVVIMEVVAGVLRGLLLFLFLLVVVTGLSDGFVDVAHVVGCGGCRNRCYSCQSAAYLFVSRTAQHINTFKQHATVPVAASTPHHTSLHYTTPQNTPSVIRKPTRRRIPGTS